jgi:pimeloyl-ACP methyl ester carboxylesterase
VKSLNNALIEAFDRNRGRIARICRAYTGKTTDAEDLFQGIMLNLNLVTAMVSGWVFAISLACLGIISRGFKRKTIYTKNMLVHHYRLKYDHCHNWRVMVKIRIVLTTSLVFVLLLAASSFAATVDGIPIHSSINGNGSKTIILVHGWTCDETSWELQVPALAGKYRVITIDLPGHGKSGTPKDGKFSIELFARAIESVRSEAKAEKVALAGHSMGTPVIINYARLYPQHVSALVFVDGAVSMSFKPPIDVRFTDQFAGPDGLKNREALIRNMFSPATTPEVQKHILSMMLGAPAETAVGAMKAMFDPAAWKEDVFPQPVLGLYPKSSRNADREYIKVHFPNMDVVEIDGVGHFLMMEKPEEFNRLLIEFLDKQKL